MAAPFLTNTPPGYQNVYIPGYMGDGESQKKLLVGYSLNEDVVALNQWVTVYGTDKPVAYYTQFNSSDLIRQKNLSGNDRRWADGADRPNAFESPRFTNRQYQCLRYGEGLWIGDLSEEFTEIGSLITLNQEFLASRALSWRSIVATAKVTDPTSYFTTSVPNVTDNYFATWTTMKAALEAASPGPGQYPTGWFGATLYSGTITVPVVKRYLLQAIKEIGRRTNGRVTEKDLLVLMNPVTAVKLSATEEFVAYLAQQSGSLDVLTGKSPNISTSTYGMPNPLYGLKCVVDATTYTLGAPEVATQTNIDYGLQQYVVPDNFIAVLARPGSVAGMSGSSGFSAMAIFQYVKQAMKPETKVDVWNKRTEVGLVDFFTAEMVAPDCAYAVGNGGA